MKDDFFNNKNNFDLEKQNELLSKYNKFFSIRYGSYLKNDNYIDITDEVYNFNIDVNGLISLIDDFSKNFTGGKDDPLFHRIQSMYILTIPYYKETNTLIANRDILETMSIIYNLIVKENNSK